MQAELRPGSEIVYSEVIPTLLWDTGPELFSYLFGGDPGRFRRVSRAEWQAPAGIHCAADSTVACRGAEVLGLINSFPSRELGQRLALTLARYDAGLDAASAAALRAADAEIGWLFPYAPTDSLMVFNLAVSPAAQGLGLGRRLMETAEAKARRLGLASIHIDTTATRDAVGFYQRIGFEAVVECRLMRPGPAAAVPPQLRMIKQLG